MICDDFYFADSVWWNQESYADDESFSGEALVLLSILYLKFTKYHSSISIQVLYIQNHYVNK
jgi:hypothetical protein